MKKFRYSEIHLEISTVCNFKCAFCPHHSLARPLTHMPFDKVCAVLQEIAEHRLSDRIAYHLMGEPLLHPEVERILKTAHALGFRNRVATNGYALRKDDIAGTLEHCDVLDISWRAADADEYKRIAPDDDYSAYGEHIARYLQTSRNAAGRVRIRMFPGKHVKPILAGLGQSGVGSIPEETIRRRTEHRISENIVLILEPCQNWTAYDSRYSCRWGECDEFETGISILVNGDVTTCCWDYDGRNVFGNIREPGGLAGCLENDKADRMRRAFRRRVLPTPFCQRCLGKSGVLKCLAYQGKTLLKRGVAERGTGKKVKRGT